MEMFELFVGVLAGIGAGMGIGLAGLSAAAVVSPMLITFLGMDPYEAIGIALASDVLASAASAYTYAKSKNIDIRNGVIMLISVLAFTFVGSYVSSLLPSKTMGNFSVVMTLLIGLKFMLRPVMTAKEGKKNKTEKQKAIQSVLCGIFVGFNCGFIGAGGGMMVLIILTCILGYELKTALGTSLFIMAFTAFTGAVSHFAIQSSLPNVPMMLTCMIATLIAARCSAGFANKASAKTLNRFTGIVLTTLGIVMIAVQYLL